VLTSRAVFYHFFIEKARNLKWKVLSEKEKQVLYNFWQFLFNFIKKVRYNSRKEYEMGNAEKLESANSIKSC